MDTLDILEEIKEDIGGQFITDENLRKWASQLTEAIYESEDIAQEAGYTINALLYECKQENFRAGCRRSKMHNEILFGRYFNLLKFVIDSLNIGNGKEVFEFCRNEIYGTNEQSKLETHLTPKEPQQRTERESNKRARRRGRPKETLKDKMLNDADGSKLQKVHTVMNGKKGKDAALIVLACIEKGWMQKPTYTQVAEEFGDIGAQQGFTKYLYEKWFTKDEIEGAINSLD